jgi:hypothetical protein
VDWLTFVSSGIKSLAWPAVVIVALFVLKRNLGDLLRSLGDRLEKAKGAGIELTFGKGIDQVEEILPASETKEIVEPITTEKIETISGLAQLPPSYIVSQAWLRFEQTIRDSVDIPNITSPSIRRASYRVMDYIDLARRQELLYSDEVPAVEQLRALRNQAAHSTDPGITLTDALRYHDIANTLIEHIKQRRQSRPPRPQEEERGSR